MSTVVQSRRNPRRTGNAVLVTGVLVVAAVYFLLPVYWLFISATKTHEGLFSSNGFWFADTIDFFENIRQVFSASGGIYLTWALNSLLYAGVGALIATYLAAAAGYALAKFDFRGRNVVLLFVLSGVLVPGTATALPLFFVFSGIGLANTYWAVLIPSLVSPFGLFLARAYADAAVPISLIEAGRIDGVGEWGIFHRIVLRQLMPALVTIFLFQFVAIWNNFFLPLVMLADEKLYPVTLGLAGWRGQTERSPQFFELTITGAMLSVIPLAILILVLQQFWRGGLTEGAVKE